MGGYGGIGRVTSELFAESGAAVAIAGRSEEKAEELAGELASAGGRAIGARVDLADRASAQARGRGGRVERSEASTCW